MNRGSRGTDGGGVRAVDVASMRPRFMNRGSSRSLRGEAARFGCFNEAPIHESGK